jgi:hypothetical protein
MSDLDTPSTAIEFVMNETQVLRQHLDRIRKGCTLMHEHLNKGGLTLTHAEVDELNETWQALAIANVPPAGSARRKKNVVAEAPLVKPKLGSFVRQHLDRSF